MFTEHLLLFVFFLSISGKGENGWLAWKRYSEYGAVFSGNNRYILQDKIILPYQIVEVGVEKEPNCLSSEAGDFFASIISTSLGISKIEIEGVEYIRLNFFNHTKNCTGANTITEIKLSMLQFNIQNFDMLLCTPAKHFFPSKSNSTECYGMAYSDSLDSFLPKNEDGELITEETKNSTRYLEFEIFEHDENGSNDELIKSDYSQYVLIGGCANLLGEYLMFFEGKDANQQKTSTIAIAYYSDLYCSEFIAYFVYEKFIFNETVIENLFQLDGNVSFKIQSHPEQPYFEHSKLEQYIVVGFYMTDNCYSDSHNDEMWVSKIVLPNMVCIDDIFGQFEISGNYLIKHNYEAIAFQDKNFNCNVPPVKIDVTTYNFSDCNLFSSLPAVKDFFFDFNENSNDKELVESVFNSTFVQVHFTSDIQYLGNYYVLFPNCDDLNFVEKNGTLHRPARYGFFMNKDICFVEPNLSESSRMAKGLKGYCEDEKLKFRQYTNEVCMNQYDYVKHEKDTAMCLGEPYVYEKNFYISCDFRMCFGYEYWEDKVCSGHGKCVKIGECVCDNGYEAKDCSEKMIRAVIVENYLFTELIVGILITLVGIIVILIVIALLSFVFGLIYYYKTKKFKDIEDIDILLEETKVKKKDKRTSTNASLKINRDLFQISYDSIKILKKIGKGGSNAVIYLVDYLGSPAAFKCFDTSDICDANQNDFTEFEKEVAIMANVKHPYILNFLGASLFPPRVGILMEVCEHGDLKSYLQKHKDTSISKRIDFLFQIASATRYLHSKSIIHRDLKLENVLVTKSLETRLMDFGLSRSIKNDAKTKTKRVGTSFYIAPEVLSGNYNEKCDIFSFSFMIFMIIQLDFQPFGKRNMFQMEYRIANDPNLRPEISDEKYGECEWLKDVTKKCWKHKPEERYSFDEVLEIFRKNMREKTTEQTSTTTKDENFEQKNQVTNEVQEPGTQRDSEKRLETDIVHNKSSEQLRSPSEVQE